MATPNTQGSIDANRVKTLVGVASTTQTVNGVNYVQGVTPVPIRVNPANNKIKIIISIV